MLFTINIILLNDCQSGEKWVSEAKYLISSVGLGEACYVQGVGNCKVFISLFCSRISDMCKQDWHDHIVNLSRGPLYIQLQPNLEYGHYFSQIRSRKHCTALCRFRTSNHRSAIETGRWHRPPIPSNDRNCIICNKVGDEYHLIF